MDRARPVRRLANEVNSVYRNIRYTVMCGESGRCGIRLVARRRTAGEPVACGFRLTSEVDAAALLFPIAEPGRLGAGGAADFPRPGRGGSRSRLRLEAGGGKNGMRR